MLKPRKSSLDVSTSMDLRDSEDECESPCFSRVIGPRPKPVLQFAKLRLSTSKENGFIEEMVRSIRNEPEARNTYVEAAGRSSDSEDESSIQTEDRPLDPLDEVQDTISSWKAEIQAITESKARVRAQKYKSRMDQWKRAEAKAKAEQERNRDLEAKFQDFVESLGKNLTSTVDELENTSMVNSDRDIFNFDIKYRPTRLLGLNDTEAEIESLSVDNVYKTTLGRLSKKTAFWIANNAEVPGETRARLQQSLEELHGRLNPQDTFWDPEIKDKRKPVVLPTFEGLGGGLSGKVNGDGDEDSIPDLLTSRTTLSSIADSEPEVDLLSSVGFLEFKSKFSNTLENMRKKGMFND